MRFTVALFYGLAGLASSVSAFPSLKLRGWEDSASSQYTSEAWRSKFVEKYLAIPSGNFSLLPEVYQDNVHLYQDRNPEPEGSINIGVTNITLYEGYIKHFRTGFSETNVSLRYWVATGLIISIQWRLDAIVQNISAQTSAPGVTAEPGHKLAYNGSDTVMINETTGKVYSVDSFFNVIDYEYQTGIKQINVGQIPNTPGCPVVLGAPSCGDYEN